jgi:hypothetical protein
MGHHYVPQYYLKGFAESSGKLIWVYEKGVGRKFHTQIKSIANITKFYSAEVEQYLANTIEGPANAILDKIRERHQISENDKKILAEYMAVMWKRVPKSKERFEEMTPRLANRLSKEFDRKLDLIATQEPTKAEFIKRRKAKIQEILDSFAEDPPKEIWLNNVPPERTPRIVAAIRAMRWTFLTFDEKPAFLTCDNPVFYFSSIGVGKPESEITFPISSNITLWATWRRDLPQDYIQTTIQALKEINRRTVSNASKYLFHCQDEDWIDGFIKKNRWQLHRLS